MIDRLTTEQIRIIICTWYMGGRNNEVIPEQIRFVYNGKVIEPEVLVVERK